jgi:rubredoxin
MTDLAPGGDATRSCPNCGAQNEIGAVVCDKCGAQLPERTGGDPQRDDLEVVEVARSVGALGYDAEFEVTGDSLTCPSCAAVFDIADASVESGQPATDSPSGGTENVVITITCPSCGTNGHAVVRTEER